MIFFYDPEGLKLSQVRLVSENILDQSLTCHFCSSIQGPQGELPLTPSSSQHIYVMLHLPSPGEEISQWEIKSHHFLVQKQQKNRILIQLTYKANHLRGAEVHLTMM